MISLLIIIYAAFISLGLPDALLGSGWPIMKMDFNVPLGNAGFVSMVITFGTIISSLVSSRILKKFGTGKVTFVSVAMTALALFGFSFAPSFKYLLFFALPLGLGAGSVDSGLNEFIAEHYKASHMNWLHCFWGIGALASPLIMSGFIKANGMWRYGYRTVAIIQTILSIILFFSLPLWNKITDNTKSKTETNAQSNNESNGDVQINVQSNTENYVCQNIPKKQNVLKRVFGLFSPLKLDGIAPVLISFFLYSGVEATMGLWGASYLVESKQLSASSAAAWVSLFYGGIMSGRLLSGFVALRLKNKKLIRYGEIIVIIGILFIMMPLPEIFTLIGFILTGVGCAPIFPGMLHETPNRFGKNTAQAVMGFQMACAYTGSAILPPVFGWIAAATTTRFLPFLVAFYAAVMLVCTEFANSHDKKRTNIAVN